jgi:hypothetical protein
MKPPERPILSPMYLAHPCTLLLSRRRPCSDCPSADAPAAADCAFLLRPACLPACRPPHRSHVARSAHVPH